MSGNIHQLIVKLNEGRIADTSLGVDGVWGFFGFSFGFLLGFRLFVGFLFLYLCGFLGRGVFVCIVSNIPRALARVSPHR